MTWTGSRSKSGWPGPQNPECRSGSRGWLIERLWKSKRVQRPLCKRSLLTAMGGCSCQGSKSLVPPSCGSSSLILTSLWPSDRSALSSLVEGLDTSSLSFINTRSLEHSTFCKHFLLPLVSLFKTKQENRKSLPMSLFHQSTGSWEI